MRIRPLGVMALTALGVAACRQSPAALLPVGGTIILSRQSIQEPGGVQDRLVGSGAFFRPPGPPAATLPAPGAGLCSLFTPTPTPSPNATPLVAWVDAGPQIILKASTRSVIYDRFSGSTGSIFYVPSTATDPTVVHPSDLYDLGLSGATGAEALPSTTLPAAVLMPPALGLSAPDLSSPPLTLPLGPLLLQWSGGDPASTVQVELLVYGTSGLSTLLCTALDTGSFTLDTADQATLPSGPGTLSLTRDRLRSSDLPDQTLLEARGEWVEGGAVVVP